MFREAIEFTLQFVGVHRVDAGCTASALGDFLEHDVLPFMGWASCASLRDSVVRVTIQESYTHSLHVYASPAELSMVTPRVGMTLSTPPPASAPTRAAPLPRRQRPRLSASTSDTTPPRASQGNHALVLLSLEDVLALLDADRVMWQSTASTAEPTTTDTASTKRSSALSSSSAAASAAPARVRLYICPTQTLRQRVLTVPLHTESMRTACDFLSDVAIHGYDLVHAAQGSARFGTYKPHLVVSGIRTLIRQQLATRCYLHSTDTHKTCYRVFPQYAVPLTQSERRAMQDGAAHGGHEDGNEAADSDEEGGEPPLFPWVVLQHQTARAFRPLDHYFERQRRLSGCFPEITFDLTLIKYIVQTSPDHTLLFSDAIRAVFGAHGISESHRPHIGTISAQRHEDKRMRGMLTWAGLRVANAFLVSHGKRRQVRLVLTAEELRRRVETQRAQQVRQQHRRLLKRARAGAAAPDGDGTIKEEDKGAEDEDEDEEAEQTLFDLATAERDGDGDGDGDDHSDADFSRSASSAGSGDDDNDDNADGDDDHEGRRRGRQGRASGTSRGAAVASSSAALQRRLESADRIFVLSPDWPLELQAGREAERGPLVASRILPNVQLDGGHRSRARTLMTYMTQYMAQRRTLTTQSIITPRSRKTFALVYEPLPGTKPAPETTIAVTPEVVATALPAQPEFVVKKEAATSVSDEATVPSVPPPAAALPSIALPLPKGLSQYAVDLVLGALNEAPHKALTMAKLCAVVDGRALQKRILPYLREAQCVYTTGTTSSVRRRVGIVALRHDGPPLDEAAKLAVAQDDADGKRQPRQTLLDRFLKPTAANALEPANGSGAIVATDLVLPAVPAMVDGLAPSAWTQRLTNTTTRASRYADTLMRIRNGHTHYTDARAGRLHLELWRQWWARVEAVEAAACTPDVKARADFSLTVASILNNMTLSTYCIVFGVAAVDLVSLLKCAGTGDRANEEDEEAGDATGEFGGEGSAAEPAVGWSTPLHALPPEVRAWCGIETVEGEHRDLVETLAAELVEQLAPLQQHGLIRLSTTATTTTRAHTTQMDDTSDTHAARTAAETRVVLATSGCTRPCHSFVFYAPHYTSTSTLLAVLRCWAHRWQQLSASSGRISHALWEAEPNMSFPAAVALQKYLRVSLTTIGRTLYQQAGYHNVVLHSARGAEQRRLWRSQREHARRARRAASGAPATRTRLTQATRGAGGGGGGGGERAVLRHRRMRLELDALDVTESVAEAFESGHPQRRLADLADVLERSWRTTVRTHPLHMPFAASNEAVRRRSTAALSSAGSGMGPHRLNSEYALHAAGHDAATYSPMLRQSMLHLGTLGRALNVVRESRPPLPWWAKRTVPHTAKKEAAVEPTVLPVMGPNGDTARSVTDLRQSLQTVLAPDLTITTATTNTDARADEHTSVTERLAAIGRFFAVPAPPVAPPSPSLKHEDAADADQTVDTADAQAELVPVADIAMDVLRMILLSDRAHYSVSLARTLLLCLSPAVISKARAALQQCPAFRTRNQSGSRIPNLALSANASFLPLPALSVTAQPCASLSLWHALAAQTDAVARRSAGRPTWSPTLIHPHASAPSAAFEVELRAQSSLDLACAEEADIVQRAGLRLPALDWPREAAALELERCRSRGHSRRAEAESIAPPPARRAKAATATPPPPSASASASVSASASAGAVKREAGSEADEDDAADGEAAVDARESRAVEQQLYPARRLAVGMGAASRIPTAPAPTPREQQAVLAATSALERLADGGRVKQSASSTGVRLRAGHAHGCGIAYPSIFHHVDGAFHPFVWQTFLMAVYRYVQHVPSIQHEDLVMRLMASGLVSRRAAQSGINFLVLSGVLRRTALAEETAQSPIAEALHDAADEATEAEPAWSWAYEATAPATGMWDLTQLDSLPPGMANMPL